MLEKNSHQCVGCGHAYTLDFFHVEGIPVDVGNLDPSPAGARRAPRGDMTLTVCPVCSIVHNRAFNADLIRFQPGYDATLSHSPSFQRALQQTARQLADRFRLQGGSVLEIGCGQGHLLRAVCGIADAQGVGIDPTCSTSSDDAKSSRVQLISSKLDHTHARWIEDLVMSISVIEDIPRPHDFLAMLRRMIGDRQVPLYFELFDGFESIETGQVWSPHYEQCNYFSESSINGLFRRSGFQIAESGHLDGNPHYLFVHALPAESGLQAVDQQQCQRVLEVAGQFADQFAEQQAFWSRQLTDWAGAGKRIVLWGSGGKAVSFLNSVDGTGHIAAVVDVNPNRQGKYVSGTGHAVVSVEHLVENRPNIVVLSNPFYRDEILATLGQADIDCEVTAL